MRIDLTSDQEQSRSFILIPKYPGHIGPVIERRQQLLSDGGLVNSLDVFHGRYQCGVAVIDRAQTYSRKGTRVFACRGGIVEAVSAPGRSVETDLFQSQRQ